MLLEVVVFLVVLVELKVDLRLEELVVILMLVVMELLEVVVFWEG